MRFSTAFLATLASVLPAVFAAPMTSVHDIQTYNGPKKSGSYIMTLKEGADNAAHLDWLAKHPSVSEVTLKQRFSTFAFLFLLYEPS